MLPAFNLYKAIINKIVVLAIMTEVTQQAAAA